MFLITFKSPKKSQQGQLLQNGINWENRRPFRVPCLLHSMETRLVKSLTSTHTLKALLIDWQKEIQNDWTKTADRGFDLRNSTSTHWTATSRSLCSTFLPCHFLSVIPGGEGAQQSFTRIGSDPRSQPLPLTVFFPLPLIILPIHAVYFNSWIPYPLILTQSLKKVPLSCGAPP